MVHLFLRKPDVYIRQLQVGMHISAINFPTPQQLVRRALLWTQGMQTTEIVQIGWRIQKLNTKIFTYTNAGLWFHICCPN